MKKIFNLKLSLLNFIETIIFILLFAKFLSLVMWWYLPEMGVELNKNVSCVMPYQQIKFNNMLEHIKEKKVEKKKKIIKVKKITASINDLILKGVYGNEKYGYIIIANKKTPNKTSIISIGESYKGYKLKAIYLDYVIFTKNGKDYILKFKQDKKNSKIHKVSSIKKVVSKQSEIPTFKASVNKKDVNFYRHNFSAIWRDIAIDEIKKNGHIEGFLIKRIRKGSKMAELGLKRGDIILKANNIPLTSYKAAMELYKNIDHIDTLNLVIKRGNEEKEITYEVH